MELARLSIALFLPWVMGSLCLFAVKGNRNNSNICLLIGYGYFVGILATTLLLRLWKYVGFDQSFVAQSGLLVGVAFVGGISTYINMYRSKEDGVNELQKSEVILWKKILWVLFFFLIVVRLYVIFQEITERPLYPWDAWWHWAAKAKIWLEWNDLAPIVNPNVWMQTNNIETYTLDGYYKPLTVSLISYWVASGIGRWDDVLINMPWFLCGIALSLAFYGQLKLWCKKPLPAIIFTYLLMSLPYLNTHIALAGYADIWVACAYALAAMAFLQWTRNRSNIHILLMLLMIVLLVQLKLPGVIWSLTFVAALLAVFAPLMLLILLLLGVSFLLVLLKGYVSLNLPVIGLVEYKEGLLKLGSVVSTQLSFHDVSAAFMRTMLYYDNWHLISIFLAISVFLYTTRGKPSQSQRAASMLILSFTLTMVFLFFYTDWYVWATDQTTINRFILHGIPMLFFSAIVLFWEIGGGSRLGKHDYFQKA